MTDQRNLIGMKDLIEGRHVHWKSHKSVRRAISNEGFPHVTVNGIYLFDLDEIKRWYKKRETKAS